MQKVVTLLEKHVQWIVLGLGGLYLLWMVWAYVLNSPVAVPVGGREADPGKVDQLVYDEKATVLEGRMKQGVNINFPPPQDPVQKFLTALEGGTQHGTLPPLVFTPPTGKLDATRPGQPVPDGAQQQPVAAIEQMENLPAVPAASGLETRRGRSTVAVPDPAGAVDPQFAALGPVRSVDRDWVTVRYTINPADIVKAFEAAKVPQQFMKTQFLRAELVRQELQPDGTWGTDIFISPLKISTLPPFPQPGDRVAIAQYNEWSRANQPEIVQPAFYAVTKGDWWRVPGEEELAQVQQPEQQGVPFDPQQYLDPKADLSKLTNEQKREVARARQDARAAQRQQQRPQRTPAGQQGGGGEFGPGGGGGGGQRGGGGGGRGPGQAYDPNRPPGYRQPMQQGGGGLPQPGEFGAPGFGPSGEFGPGSVTNQPMQPQAGNYAALFPIPNGEFDPRTVEKGVTGWVHDDTVEPGKTYRYKIRYRIKSPVFQTFNVMKVQAQADQFDLIAPDSEWTSPITIPALTNFFIAANFDADSTRNVRFDVFKFQDGTLHAQAFTAGPGDSIGRLDKGVDFATGYSVVDIRRDLKNNASFVLISDPAGRLMQRTFRGDQEDPELRKLRQQRDGQASAGGAGG